MDSATEPRAKRRVYTVAQRVALVKRTRSLMRREGLTVEKAAGQLGYHWTNYYAWAKQGNSKAHRAKRHKAPSNGRDPEQGLGWLASLSSLAGHEERLTLLENEWVAFKRALGVKPEDLQP